MLEANYFSGQYRQGLTARMSALSSCQAWSQRLRTLCCCRWRLLRASCTEQSCQLV